MKNIVLLAVIVGFYFDWFIFESTFEFVLFLTIIVLFLIGNRKEVKKCYQ